MKENKGIKKWGFLFVLLMMCLLPSIRVNADSEQVLSLVGDDAISPGTTISYKVDITSMMLLLLLVFHRQLLMIVQFLL